MPVHRLTTVRTDSLRAATRNEPVGFLLFRSNLVNHILSESYLDRKIESLSFLKKKTHGGTANKMRIYHAKKLLSFQVMIDRMKILMKYQILKQRYFPCFEE